MIFRTISDEQTTTFATLPNPPSSLVLHDSTPSSLTVKWEGSAVGAGMKTEKFKLTIENEEHGYSFETTVTGDKTTYNFSKLDVVGTGSLKNFNFKLEPVVT